MSSRRALRYCMQGLVLLNLVFVQMTGAAGLHWLLPLYALTIGMPLLERYRERLAYRLLWNGGVVSFFFVLLRHALRADLLYVLEDGLVLAALCQVHLLNNLRSSQRPDLLFFNAFLIAIITGFMNRGLGFPVAFLAFVPFFVVGLQLLSATRDGRSPSPEVTRRLALDGSRRAAVLLALSFLAFLFWPRDFERKAFFRGTFEMPTGGSQALEIGFNEKLRLDRKQRVSSSGRAAMRVTLLQGEAGDVPALWRGATLAATDGGNWSTLSTRRAGVVDEPWSGRRGRLEREGAGAPGGPRVEVVRLEQGTERLFLPLGTRALQLAAESSGLLLRPRPDGTVDVAEEEDVRYELSLAARAGVERGGIYAAELPSWLVPYTELPEDSEEVEHARELADRLAERWDEDAPQQDVVARLSEHLARSYSYLPPGTEGAADSLADFLSGKSGGHCELFASALATMLRTRGVPCRVVTGLRSTRWDAEGKTLSFGTRDAHAWVEVCDPVGGWYAVDPSPAWIEQGPGTSLLARWTAAARSVWDSVTDFDSERRAAVYAWIRSLPRRTAAWLERDPLQGVLAAVLAALPVALYVLRRRARTQPEVRAYRTALRRAQLRLLPGETPRELVKRARAEGLEGTALRALEDATVRHEEARYAA
ncbi:MAG: transglutaminaseTgpA domain-containing protein [Planctomycetota bacterium]